MLSDPASRDTSWVNPLCGREGGSIAVEGWFLSSSGTTATSGSLLWEPHLGWPPEHSPPRLSASAGNADSPVLAWLVRRVARNQVASGNLACSIDQTADAQVFAITHPRTHQSVDG